MATPTLNMPTGSVTLNGETYNNVIYVTGGTEDDNISTFDLGTALASNTTFGSRFHTRQWSNRS